VPFASMLSLSFTVSCTVRPDLYFPKSTHHIHICVVIMNEISISVIYFLSVYDLHSVITADTSPSSVL
jgi:hypothetical protein